MEANNSLVRILVVRCHSDLNTINYFVLTRIPVPFADTIIAKEMTNFSILHNAKTDVELSRTGTCQICSCLCVFSQYLNTKVIFWIDASFSFFLNLLDCEQKSGCVSRTTRGISSLSKLTLSPAHLQFKADRLK